MRLIDERTNDGSRRFARFPAPADWTTLQEHLHLLPEMEAACASEPSGLSFSYRGHAFRIRREGAEVLVEVCDPLCSDLLLFQVAYHLSKLAGRT